MANGNFMGRLNSWLVDCDLFRSSLFSVGLAKVVSTDETYVSVAAAVSPSPPIIDGMAIGPGKYGTAEVRPSVGSYSPDII